MAAPPAESTEEELLAMWAEDLIAEPAPGARLIEVAVRVDVTLMLGSRSHTEELVRDLQLVLLGSAALATVASPAQEVVWLARRLDAATEEFAGPREQILRQALLAERAGADEVTLHLLLRREDSAAARRWMEAIDDAEALAAKGALLTGAFPPALTAFRRAYIAAIRRALEAPTKLV